MAKMIIFGLGKMSIVSQFLVLWYKSFAYLNQTLPLLTADWLLKVLDIDNDMCKARDNSKACVVTSLSLACNFKVILTTATYISSYIYFENLSTN